MIEVNPQNSQLSKASGILAVETPDGHRQWALVADAEIRYDAEVGFSDGVGQFTVIATLPPGESLRTASTIEAGEENVLVYSRLLVAVLREERERYAELEKRHDQRGAALSAAQAENRRLAEDRAEALHESWADGARNGFVTADAGLPLEVAFERNPHPEPEDDEEPGCHICGGPDH